MTARLPPAADGLEDFLPNLVGNENNTSKDGTCQVSEKSVPNDSNSSKKFLIPKVKWSQSTGCRCVLEPKSRLWNDIISVLEGTALDKQFKWNSTWSLRTISHVVNADFQQRFSEKKQELKQLLSREPQECYSFGLTESDQKADDICSSGSFAGQSLNVPLGTVDQGVNVCQFPDVLLRWAEKKDFIHLCIVVYKILKGRCKTVPARTSIKQPVLDPTPNVDHHVSCGTPNTKEPIFMQLSKSQIFLYEYDDEALPVKHPRHCLPFAVVSLTAKNSVSTPSSATGLMPDSKQSSRLRRSACFKDLSTKETVDLDNDSKRKTVIAGGSPPRKSGQGEVLLSDATATCRNSLKNHIPINTMKVECFDSDEKENGAWKDKQKLFQQSASPTSLDRMNLSDRFANMNPMSSKLEDPKMEQVRQETLKVYERLQAVRTERINNARLGIGSSSEDEQHSSQKGLNMVCKSSETTSKTTRNNNGANVQDSKKSVSEFGHLKITIINPSTEPSPKNCEVENDDRVLQQYGSGKLKGEALHINNLENRKTIADSGRSPEHHLPIKDKRNANRKSPSQSRVSSHSKKPYAEAKRMTHKFESKKSSFKKNQRQDAWPKGNGFGHPTARRGRVRLHCPEYFQKGDSSDMFDLEKELYEAASNSVQRAYKKDLTPSEVPKKQHLFCVQQNERNWDKRGDKDSGRFPIKHLQKQEYSNDSSKNVSGSYPCRQSLQNTCTFKTDVTDSDILNLDVGDGNHDTKEPVSNYVNPSTSRDLSKSDLDSYEMAMSLEKVSDEESCVPLILAETKECQDNLEVQDMDVDNETSRESWDKDSSSTRLNEDGILLQDQLGTDEFSSYLHNAAILAKLAKYKTHEDSKRERVRRSSCHSEGSSNSRKSVDEVEPAKRSKQMFFHGRPLIPIRGRDPYKLLLDNIPGLVEPVDPRAALSALFGRKHEIELKKVPWSSEKPPECVKVTPVFQKVQHGIGPIHEVHCDGPKASTGHHAGQSSSQNKSMFYNASCPDASLKPSYLLGFDRKSKVNAPQKIQSRKSLDNSVASDANSCRPAESDDANSSTHFSQKLKRMSSLDDDTQPGFLTMEASRENLSLSVTADTSKRTDTIHDSCRGQLGASSITTDQLKYQSLSTVQSSMQERKSLQNPKYVSCLDVETHPGFSENTVKKDNLSLKLGPDRACKSFAADTLKRNNALHDSCRGETCTRSLPMEHQGQPPYQRLSPVQSSVQEERSLQNSKDVSCLDVEKHPGSSGMLANHEKLSIHSGPDKACMSIAADTSKRTDALNSSSIGKSCTSSSQIEHQGPPFYQRLSPVQSSLPEEKSPQQRSRTSELSQLPDRNRLSKRRVKSPHRSSPSPHRNSSPYRESRSSRMKNRSPQTRSRSPQRKSRSPQRKSRSPQRKSKSPQRKSKSPQRKSRSPYRRRSTDSSSRSTSQERSVKGKTTRIYNEHIHRAFNEGMHHDDGSFLSQ